MIIVPHTHWDREWYLPFQRFRLKLVDLVDRVLDMLERDERFVFTLDGQLATVDDYLEVRPERAERIRRLVESGRLAIGPWQTLMDEFLVSGETIVRNLECGLRRAEELGGAMRVGYLPDMFGHVAQMPQILRRVGIDRAVVWRGVPAAITHHAFTWEAPDGSEVTTEYLPGGYSNGAHLLDVPGRLADNADGLAQAMQPFFEDEPVLAMYGTDHAEPLPELVEIVEEANRSGAGRRLELATLDRYLEAVDGATQRWRGELRSGARANLLMGVVSARIDLKAAAARAERALERYAEPFCALYAAEWPERLLELAWRRVLENSAHDSICGCSTDEVSAQVLVRYAEAEQIGRGLAERAAARVAGRAPRGTAVVLNPSPEARADVVELDLPVRTTASEVALELADGTRVATQELARSDRIVHASTLRAGDVPTFLARRLHGRELFGYRLSDAVVDESGLTLWVDVEDDPPRLDVDEVLRAIEQAAEARAETTWEVRVRARPRLRMLARVPVSPLGWTSVRAVEGAGELEHAVRAEERALDNGLLHVEVADDGTLRLGAVEDVGRVVDGGDAGDSYNYAPPERDTLVERAELVGVDVIERGPVRGRLVVVRRYRWPAQLAADANARTDELLPVEVEMHIELRAGEPFVRVRVEFENRCADHRVRFHVPLSRPAKGSHSEGQFAVVERGLEAEGGWGEVPLPTFPAHGSVDAGGLAVLLEHVLEYELVDGRELALTLLRSKGLISRNEHPYREEPAGPDVAIPAAQLRGPLSVSFALYPHAGDWCEGGVVAEAERYRHPFTTTVGLADGGRPGEEEGLEVEGASLSALRRRDGWLELRLVRLDPQPGVALVRGDFGEARYADLLGRPGAQLQLQRGRLELELSAWTIQTIQLR